MVEPLNVLVLVVPAVAVDAITSPVATKTAPILLAFKSNVVMTEALFMLLELMVLTLSVFKFNGSLVCAILVMVVTPAEVDKVIPVPACRF